MAGLNAELARRAPHDPRLAGLTELFPERGAPDTVAQALHELTGHEVDARSARVQYVRYRPGRSCTVLWELPGEERPELVTGVLFSGDRGARTVRREAFLDAMRGPRTFTHCEDRTLVVHRFPFDPKMPKLAEIDRDLWVERSLAPRVGLRHARTARRRALAYKPWRRCVMRYDAGERSVFAKVYRDDRGAFLSSVLARVASELRGAAWRTPAPLAYFEEERVLAFEGLGEVDEVSDLVRAARDDARARARLLEQLARMGEGLRDLRRVRVAGLPRRGPLDVLALLRERAEGVVDVAPDLARTVGERLARLERLARELPEERAVTSHGALRHDQVVTRSDELWVLDLDTLCTAGAGADAGNLLGHLDLLAARRKRIAGLVDACRAAFLAGYAEGGGEVGAWLAWHRATAQVKKLLRSFLALDARWPQMLEASNELFESTIAEVERVGRATIRYSP